MQEVGHAALAIIPSFKGFQSDLEKGSSKAMVAAGKSGGKEFGESAGDEATKGMTSKIGDWSKKGAAALGAGIGLAVGYGFKEGIDRERIGDVIAASQGLSAKQQQRQGKIAGSLYANAFGESYEEVARGVAAASSSLPGLEGNGEIRRASADALNFAQVFEVDIARAVQVAGTLINSKLAPDAERAFDLLTRSSQKVPVQLREDVLDAAEEYGQFFATLGYDGKQAFDLLVAGSKQGMYGIDKAGDAIKEFTIRSTDMSTASKDAYKAIGLDARVMADDILKGGDDAQEATQKIIDGLLGIESPSQRAEAAIALFGTPLEDLNVRKIPAFLRSLQGTSGELDKVKGSADRMGDTLAGNLSTDITKMKRKLENDLVDFISTKGLPALESFSDWVEKDGAPAFRNFKDDIKPVARVVGDLVDAFSDLPAAGKIGALGGALAGGIVVKHQIGKLFERGGIANPMFVVVTNPGSTSPDVTPDGKPKPGRGGLGAGTVAALTAVGLPILDDQYKQNPLLTKSGDWAERMGNKLGLPNWFEGDNGGSLGASKAPTADWKGIFDGTNTGGGKTSPDLERLAKGFEKAGDKAWGAAKMVDGFTGDLKGTGRQADRTREAIERVGRARVKPEIDTSSIEAALALFRQLPGMEGVVGPVDPSLLAPRAGITNNFNGPMHVADGRDLTREAEKKARARSRGGR